MIRGLAAGITDRDSYLRRTPGTAGAFQIYRVYTFTGQGPDVRALAV